jgi:hypothetical protein
LEWIGLVTDDHDIESKHGKHSNTEGHLCQDKDIGEWKKENM